MAGKFWTSHEVFYVIDLAGWQKDYPVPACLFPIEWTGLHLHFKDEQNNLFSVYAREEVALLIEYQQVSAQPAVYICMNYMGTCGFCVCVCLSLSLSLQVHLANSKVGEIFLRSC